MNLIKYFVALSLYTGMALSSAMFDQKEALVIDLNNTFVGLEPYFNAKPTLFGIVSNKTHSYRTTGNLCYANSYAQFVNECSNKIHNNNWIVLHNYDPTLTPDFVAKINNHTDENLFNLRSFILVDNDFGRNVGFDRKVQDWT
jgi:hypothetical protein